MQRACIVDPIGDEGADRVEGLPEGHDITADLRWCHFTNVYGTGSWDIFFSRCVLVGGFVIGAWALTQGHTLADTDDDTTGHEAADAAFGGKSLHHGSADGDEAAETHANPTSKIIGLVNHVSGQPHVVTTELRL